MESQEHRFTFPFEARYHQLGKLSAGVEEVWFVLHGYGQLSEYFIRHFKTIEEANRVIIAPEGLSRFYLSSTQGRVGATWMTKEDRLTDIKNYLSYLNAIYDLVMAKLKGTPVKITVLGFSQGAATATRWVTQTEMAFDRLVLWAGVFPPDLKINRASEQLENKEVYFVYGNQDPYLSKEGPFLEMKAIARSLKVVPTTLTFEGEHTLDAPTLLELAQAKH